MGKEELMADINNFGDIQENFDHITELLDAVRAQNALNAGDMDKVLTDINSRLQSLSEEENTELIKVFLAELKKSLEDRHSFVSAKFSEMEKAFNSVVENTKDNVKPHEIKEVFDIIATNLNVFSKEVVTQKDLLGEINLRIDDLKNDESQKKDIIRNISVLKVELEKLNNGFESIILNLNDNFTAVSQAMVKLDSGEMLDSVKKDIENVFLSSNAILSALQVIDHKNRELEKVITNLVSKEDFEVERSQVATLISQNSELTAYISKLANQSGVEDLNQKVDTAVGIINAMKNLLADATSQNQRMLSAQLEKLEETVATIISEEQFERFRADLLHLVDESTQSSNLVRAELLDTNVEMKTFLTTINSLDIKNNLQQFMGLVKKTEENIKSTIFDIAGKFNQTAEQNKKLITTEVNGNIDHIASKIDLVEGNLSQASNSNLAAILDSVQTVVTDLTSLKGQVKSDSMDNLATIEAGIRDLREEVGKSKDSIVRDAKQNLENIVLNLGSIFQRLDAAKETLSENAQENLEKITLQFSQLVQKIAEVKSELSEEFVQNVSEIKEAISALPDAIKENQAVFEDVKTVLIEQNSKNIEELSQKLDSVKNNVSTGLSQNISSIKEIISPLPEAIRENQAIFEDVKADLIAQGSKNVEELSQTVAEIKDVVRADIEENISEVKVAIASLPEAIKENQTVFEEAKTVLIEQNSKNIEELSQKLDGVKNVVKAELSLNIQEVKDAISPLPEAIKENQATFESVKADLLEQSSKNVEEITQTVASVKKVVRDDIEEKISLMKDVISSLPLTIKENQVAFEDEKRVLIEQNSKNIEDLSEKVQKLIQGVLAKDSANKEQVQNEISDLKDVLATMEENLSTNNLKVGEDIHSSIRDIESAISQANDNYDISLHNLQTKLVEYLESIKESASESDLKVVTSFKESLSGIEALKSEIKAVAEKISMFDNESNFTQLSDDIEEKFQEMLVNIKEFEETTSLSHQENLQKSVEDLNVQFDNVLSSLEEYKASLGESVGESFGELLEQVVEQVGSIKSQISLTNVDLVKSIDEKTAAMTSGIEEIKELIEQISHPDFDNVVSELKTQVDASCFGLISKLKENFKDENSELIENFSTTYGLLGDKLDKLKTDLCSKNSDDFEDLKAMLENISDKNSSESNFDEVLNTNKEEIIHELDSVKEDLLQEFESVKTSIKQESSSSSLEDIRSEIQELLEEITVSQEKLSSQKLDLAEVLKVNEDEAKSQLASIEKVIIDEISQNVGSFKEAVENVSKDIEEKISISETNYKDSISSVLSEVKQSFYEKVEEDLDDLKAFIEVVENRSDFSSTIDGLKSDVFEKFSSLTKEIEDSISDISVKEDLEAVSKGIEDSVSDLLENLYDRMLIALEDNQLTQNLISKSEEIADRIEDLRAFALEDIAEKIENFNVNIDKQAEDFSNLISEVKVSIGELKETYVDLSVNSSMEISSLLSSIQEKIENIDEKLDKHDFSEIIESSKKQLMQEISSVKESVEKNDLSTQLSEGFDLVNQKVDALMIAPEDTIEEDLEEIKSSIEAQSKLLEDLTVLKQLDKLSELEDISTAQSEIKKLIADFDTRLEKISSEKVEDNNDVQEIKAELEKLRKDIVEKVLEAIDKISLETDEQGIKDFVEEKSIELKDEIKKEMATFNQNAIENATNLFGQISFEVEAEDIKSFVDEKIDETKDEIIETLSNVFEKKASNLETEELKDFVQEQSENAKDEIIETLSNAFGKTTLILETEELKDFVQEKSEEVKDEIKESLQTSLGTNFEEIISSLDTLHDKSQGVDSHCFDIRREIGAVKKHLQSLQNGAEGISDDFSGYSYTLQDIETDIAKVRMILNDILKSRQGNELDQLSNLEKLNDLEKMNEDIISISARTNKLLLTSDDSNNVLKENLNEFKNIVYKLEEKVNYIDTTEANQRIEKKLETVNNLLVSSAKSDKIFNQAFMYLAEWVDGASENMGTIIDKVSDMDGVKLSLAEIKKNMPKKADTDVILNKLADKFTRQEEKIKSLEAKIEKLANRPVAKAGEVDYAAIVQEVLAQVGVAEKKAETKLTKKVDNIDKQLAKFGKSIEKLASYVDEG